MLSSKDIANIILHILIMAVFITLFFFTYGAYLEKKIVKQQMNYIVDDLVGDIKVISPETATTLKNQLLNIKSPNLEQADKQAEENNSKLKMKTLKIVIGVSIVTLFVIYYMVKYFDLDVKNLIVANIISLIAVGLTYFMFSTYIIANYKSADPNFIKKSIIESVTDYGKDVQDISQEMVYDMAKNRFDSYVQNGFNPETIYGMMETKMDSLL